MSSQSNDTAPDGRERADIPRWRQKLGLRGWQLHLAIAVVLVAVLWSLLGYVIAPWAVERYAPGLVHERLGVRLAMDEVRIDPWRLRAEVRGVELTHAELGHLAGVSRAAVNLELASLWNRAWLVSEVLVDGPGASVVRLPDGDWNLARAFEPRDETPPDDAAPPEFLLERLVIRAGQIDFVDHTVPSGYATTLGPINVALENFGTTDDAGGMHAINARLADGGTVIWRSSLELEPLLARGRLEVRDASGALVWRYFRDRVNFELLQGRWDVSFDYQFSLDRTGPELTVEGGEVALREIAIGDRDADEAIVELPSAAIEGASFRLADMQLAVRDVRAGGLLLKVRRDSEGAINLARIFALRPTDAPPADASASDPTPAQRRQPDGTGDDAAATEATQSGQSLRWELESVAIDGARIEVRDEAAPAPVDFAVENLDLALADFRSAEGHRARLELEADVESGGRIEVEGELAASPQSLEATASIESLDLLPFAAYAADVANLRFHSAKAFLDGRISVGADQPFRFEGDAALADLAASLPDAEDPVVAWQRVDLTQIVIDMAGRSADIDRVTLSQPFLQVQVSRNGELNLGKVAAGDESSPPEGDEPDSRGEPFQVTVQEVLVDAGEIMFEDLSLPLPFAARIRSLEGSVSRISSHTDTPARLKLGGSVEEYGSASVDGQLDLFDPTRLADLVIEFRNVKMPDLSPYTVDFAGRAIEEGTIDLTLDWEIRRGELRASNDMVIEQLKLGPKQDVEGASDLPLDLAVALLKDSQGRIDIDLPVSGDLDDPKFSYAGLVFKALRQLLADIATAPFKLLGALLGGGGGNGDSLEYVPFPPGESSVTGPQREGLDVLREALGQRPQLSLEVPAVFHPRRDARALRAERLEAVVTEQLEAGREDEDPRRTILESLYAEAKGDEALESLQEKHLRAPQDGGQDAEPALATGEYLEALRGELEALQPVSDEELQELGRHRARAVREYLVSEGAIDPNRVSVSDPAAASKADDQYVYMKLTLSAASQ